MTSPPFMPAQAGILLDMKIPAREPFFRTLVGVMIFDAAED